MGLKSHGMLVLALYITIIHLPITFRYSAPSMEMFL